MEVTCSYMVVDFQWTTQCYIPKDRTTWLYVEFGLYSLFDYYKKLLLVELC
jgi:hypothetical protein